MCRNSSPTSRSVPAHLCFVCRCDGLRQGIRAVMAVMLYAGAGFLGVSCVAALTKRFGALHSAITTTARKAVTLLLSFVVFPNKPFSVQHGVGAVVFVLGLVVSFFFLRGPSL